MKVLGIACSLRKGSNSQILVEHALASAREVGAETELLTLFGRTMTPCDGCGSCAKTGICHVKDDLQECIAKVDQSQAVIFGTPVYFWSLAGQAKLVLDRLYALYRTGKLANKVGGVIAVAGNVGHMSAVSAYMTFFCASHMLAADFVTAFGSERGDVRRDRHATQAAWELGKQVVELASSQFRYLPC